MTRVLLGGILLTSAWRRLHVPFRALVCKVRAGFAIAASGLKVGVRARKQTIAQVALQMELSS